MSTASPKVVVVDDTSAASATNSTQATATAAAAEDNANSSGYNAAHFSASRAHLFDSRTTVPSAAEQHGYTNGHAFVVSDASADVVISEEDAEKNSQKDEEQTAGKDATVEPAFSSRRYHKRSSTGKCSIVAIPDDDDVASLTDFRDVETILGACERGKNELGDELGTPVVLELAEYQPSGCFANGLCRGVVEDETKTQEDAVIIASPQKVETDQGEDVDTKKSVILQNSAIASEKAGEEIVPAEVKEAEEKRKSIQRRRLNACKDSMELIPVRGAKHHGVHSHLPEVAAIQLPSHGEHHGHGRTPPHNEDPSVDPDRKRSVQFMHDEADFLKPLIFDNEPDAVDKKESFQESRRKSESREALVSPTGIDASAQESSSKEDSVRPSPAKSAAEPRPPESTTKRTVSSPRHKSLQQGVQSPSLEQN